MLCTDDRKKFFTDVDYKFYIVYSSQTRFQSAFYGESSESLTEQGFQKAILKPN